MAGSGSINWLKELSKSENKSRNIKRGKGLQFSSIDGWTEDKLPKLLIVWNFEKESTEQFPSQSREGKFTKPRDISATVVSYEAFLITKESQSIVPWESEISHKELVKIHWTEEWIDKLDKETRALNEMYKGRPITFQTSFKNGKYLRLQYQVKNYSKLPKAPKEVMDVLHRAWMNFLACSFVFTRTTQQTTVPLGGTTMKWGAGKTCTGRIQAHSTSIMGTDIGFLIPISRRAARIFGRVLRLTILSRLKSLNSLTEVDTKRAWTIDLIFRRFNQNCQRMWIWWHQPAVPGPLKFKEQYIQSYSFNER